MTRTAIYARYSTDLQRDASIEDQIRLCEKKVRDAGGQVYQSYTDSVPRNGVTLFFGHGLAAVTGRRLSPGPWG